MTPQRPIDAAEACLRRGDVAAVMSHLASARPEGLEEELRVGLLRAEVLLLSGFPKDAAAYAAPLVAQSRALGDPDLEVDALLAHARVCHFLRRDRDVTALLDRAARLGAGASAGRRAQVLARRGLQDLLHFQLPAAVVKLSGAAEALEALGDPERAEGVWLQMASALVRSGRMDEAHACLARVTPRLMAPPVRQHQGSYWSLRAQMDWRDGDVAQAELSLRRALAVYGQLGMVPQQVDCTSNLAEVLRASGRLEEARELYRRLVQVRTGGDPMFIPALNLAIVELQLGRGEEAARQAEALLLAAGAEQVRGWGEVLLYFLRIAGCLHDPAKALTAFRSGAAALRAAGALLAPDVPLVLREVGYQAQQAQLLDLAVRLRALALDAFDQQERFSERDAEVRALQSLRAEGAPAFLGDLRLDERIGRGGMGEVWRAVDGRSGQTVAVKLIRARFRDGEKARLATESLQREVRQVAALEHPGIVHVLDTGQVPPSAVALTEGALVEGTPWVSMELVEGGTLTSLCGHVAWPVARQILLSLLDALAHAHAHGRVHLDLKPANVLLGGGGVTEGLADVRLVDFGIARGFRVGDENPLQGGTPRYMAPEQFHGQWRSVGPWTDLYGLGCLATELLQGHAPFVGSTEELRDGHCHRQPPPLRATCAVPVGIDAWLRRLMAKHPTDRFLRAADAALALRELDGQPQSATTSEVASDGGDAVTFSLDELDLGRPAQPGEELSGSAEGLPALAEIPRVACPERLVMEPAARPRGLAMYAYRPPPPVERLELRQALWSGLFEVCRARRCAWVELTAPRGVGVRELSIWIGRRAHALGVASPLLVEEGHDLAHELAVSFSVQGLTGEELRRQLAVRARPWGLSDEEIARAAASLEGAAVLQEVDLWVPALTRERAVVLVVGSPTPSVREGLAGLVGREIPLYIVSYRDPLVPLAGVTAPRVLAVEPVDDDAMASILDQPKLSATLRYELIAAAEGCEGVARATLRDLVQAGMVVDAEEGLQRRSGLHDDLSPTVSAVWGPRMHALHQRLPPVAQQVLEIVCVVPGSCSRASLGALGASQEAVDESLASLLAEGWLRAEGPDAVRPRVAGVRAAVREQLTATVRFGSVALVAAKGLGDRPSDQGTLLLQGGHAEAACEPLLRGATEAMAAGELSATEVLLRRWEHSARQLGMDADDPRWGEGMALLAQLRSPRAEAGGGDWPG